MSKSDPVRPAGEYQRDRDKSKNALFSSVASGADYMRLEWVASPASHTALTHVTSHIDLTDRHGNCVRLKSDSFWYGTFPVLPLTTTTSILIIFSY